MTDKLEKMNPKVAVFSVIRRWDHYVPRTIDSVVAQTYENWEWYIYTSPKSQDEIEAVTKDEPRIHLVHNRNFHCHCEDMTKGEKLSNGIVETAQKGDFFCVIDGDDRMTEDFMEYQLEYILKHDLDISASSVVGRNEQDEVVKNTDKVVPCDMVISKEELFTHFPLYRFHYVTLWRKIFRSSLFSAELYENMPLLRSVNDKPVAFPTLKKARRIGVTKKVGYLYSMHQEGMSYQNYQPLRETEPFLLQTVVSDVLEGVKPNNSVGTRKKIDYIKSYCLNSDLLFSLRALIQSSLGTEEKINKLHVIYTNEATKAMFQAPEQYKSFLATLDPRDPYKAVGFSNFHGLKEFLFKLIGQVNQESIHYNKETQEKLIEAVAVLSADIGECLSYSTLLLFGSRKEFFYRYFDMVKNVGEENRKKLIVEMESFHSMNEPSIEVAELLDLIGKKTDHLPFQQASLAMKLKLYQESGQMEEMMAVMDNMIAMGMQL